MAGVGVVQRERPAVEIPVKTNLGRCPRLVLTGVSTAGLSTAIPLDNPTPADLHSVSILFMAGVGLSKGNAFERPAVETAVKANMGQRPSK